MAFNLPLPDSIRIFFHPEIANVPDPVLVPQPPETLDDLLGVEVAFRHSNRHLYPDTYTGKVSGWHYESAHSSQPDYPDGWLVLEVKSPTFNITKHVPEWDFVCYRWELVGGAS